MIDKLIEQGRSFAVWRIPGEDKLHFRMQSTGKSCLLYDINELNGRSGFVIAPFNVSERHPIVLIEPDSLEFSSESIDSFIRMKTSFHSDETELSSEWNEKERYAYRFSLFTKPLLDGTQDKLVLSRSLSIKRENGFSPNEAFKAAVKRYVRSYVYLCHTPETGTWLGSTPEILLSGERGAWHTVALAGTQPIVDGNTPTNWDKKNIEEQQIVASYIKDRLSSLAIKADERGPYTARAGEVCHLKSDFFFSLPNPEKLGELLKLLHPTPAVCGLPKMEAYDFIIKNEGYDRSYYSGFIGWLDPKGRSDLYVNLRCMNIGECNLTLYAGGGLLAASKLEEEWHETEIKLDTMRRLIMNQI